MSIQISDASILADIRRLARELKRQPSITDYRAHGRFAHSLPTKRFGSWRATIERAGLRYIDRRRSPARTNEELEADLKRVANILMHPPTATEYDRLGRYNSSIFYKRGGRRWMDVLAAFLRLDEEEARKAAHGARNYRTTDERLNELRALARKLKHTPSLDVARKSGIEVVELRSRLGAWSKVVEAAGLKRVSSRKRPAFHLTNEELLAEVRRVARFVGKPPSSAVFNEHSRVNYKTVIARLKVKGWREVKQLIGVQNKWQ